MKKLLQLIVVLFISACNSGAELSGTYVPIDNDKYAFTFKPNKIIEFSNLNEKLKVTTYEQKDNKITFKFEGGLPGEFVINKDGSLILYGVDKYIKKN